MQSNYSVDDLILNYDPEFPQARFLQAGLEAAQKSSTGRFPGLSRGRRVMRRQPHRSCNLRRKPTISAASAVTMPS